MKGKMLILLALLAVLALPALAQAADNSALAQDNTVAAALAQPVAVAGYTMSLADDQQSYFSSDSMPTSSVAANWHWGHRGCCCGGCGCGCGCHRSCGCGCHRCCGGCGWGWSWGCKDSSNEGVASGGSMCGMSWRD